MSERQWLWGRVRSSVCIVLRCLVLRNGGCQWGKGPLTLKYWWQPPALLNLRLCQWLQALSDRLALLAVARLALLSGKHEGWLSHVRPCLCSQSVS